MEGKKKQYGLPEIGGANVAATLARRREQQPREEEPAPIVVPAEPPATPKPPAKIDTTPVVKDPPLAVVRQGVDFRRDHLDLITEMIYRCHRQRIRLQGKKGPSLIVRAALDELATIYTTDPARFDEIMRRYSQKQT
jgi:hypothetical protein